MAVVTAPAMPTPPRRGKIPRGRANDSRRAELGSLLLAMAVVTGFFAVVEMQLLERITATFWCPR